MQDVIPLRPDDLDRVFAWNLIRAARRAAQLITEALRPIGLSPVQFGVLAHLSVAGAMTQADLARAVIVRPQSMAPLLDGLQQRGLIGRAVKGGRGRPTPVRLTSAGAELLASAWIAALATNDLRLSGVSSGDAVRVNSVLIAMIDRSSAAAPSAVIVGQGSGSTGDQRRPET